MTAKDLHDLEASSLYEFINSIQETNDLKDSKHLARQIYDDNKMLFQLQTQQFDSCSEKDLPLWKICCLDNKLVGPCPRINLDLELVDRKVSGSIGDRLL